MQNMVNDYDSRIKKKKSRCNLLMITVMLQMNLGFLCQLVELHNACSATHCT